MVVADSAWVIRIDAGTLRPPVETPQGFLRVDGYVGRPGIYRYINNEADVKAGLGKLGEVRLELRPDDEVFRVDALAGFEGAPLTNDHPKQMITSDNVRRFEVGTSTGAARRDGDKVAASMVIKDKKTIEAVRAGHLRELSPGYRTRLDKTPGVDPKYGRYHVVQRDITINHLALVDRARGGSEMQIRMDGADALPIDVAVERSDDASAVLLTTVVNDHQHTMWVCEGSVGGETSYATADASKGLGGHSHGWIRNADGSVTVAENDGHTHELAAMSVVAPDPAAPSPIEDEPSSGKTTVIVVNSDSAARTRQGEGMEIEEQIRSLKAQLGEAEKKADERAGALAVTSERADKAAARVVTLEDTIKDLNLRIAAGANAAESVAISEQAERADRAEKLIADHDRKFDEAVKERADVINRAQRVMGYEFRTDKMSLRTIREIVVKKLRPTEDTSAKVTDAYIAGRFDSLVEGHSKTARSLEHAGDVISRNDEVMRNDSASGKPAAPTDSREARRRDWREQAKKPVLAPSTRRKDA